MVFGMLTVIPVSAAGTDDSESGAAKEYYQIAVGTTAVTSENYRDILGNGTASYDPGTSTLTLNNPKLTGAMYPDEGVIYINRKENVTIKGNYQMTDAIAKCGIESVGPITLNGNFTLIGKRGGAASNQSVSVTGGTVNAIGATESNSVGISVGEGCNLTIADGITRVRAKGNQLAVVTDKLILNNNRITSPQGAFFKEYYGNIILEDFSGVANDVTIEPSNVTDYDVWVGYRRVTSANKGDVYGDGKVSYDPASKTLTLKNPTIPGGNNPRREHIIL